MASRHFLRSTFLLKSSLNLRCSRGGHAGPLPVLHKAHDVVTLLGRDDRADLRANHFARNHDLHPAILLPALRRVIGSHRLSLAEALRRDRTRRHSLLSQVIANRLAALFGKRLVVVIAADAVGVAFDIQP